MELTKNDSKMLQGLAVMAMVILHLFDRMDYQELFRPLIFFKEIPLSFYIAQLSDFCVFCFAFCSGYAHMKLSEQTGYYSRRLHGLLRLLVQYWIIIVVFSIVSISTGSGSFMPGNLKTLAGNVFLYKITYNGAWWYMWAYTLIVLISPAILRLCKKWHPLLMLTAGFGIYCLAYYVRFNMDQPGFLLDKFGPFGMTLFEYIVGCVCYRIKFFTWTYRYWNRFRPVWRRLMASVIIIALLVFRTLIVPSLFVAPCSGPLLLHCFISGRSRNSFKICLPSSEDTQRISGSHICFSICIYSGILFISPGIRS